MREWLKDQGLQYVEELWGLREKDPQLPDWPNDLNRQGAGRFTLIIGLSLFIKVRLIGGTVKFF
jgi:hypothetical protein